MADTVAKSGLASTTSSRPPSRYNSPLVVDRSGDVTPSYDSHSAQLSGALDSILSPTRHGQQQLFSQSQSLSHEQLQQQNAAMAYKLDMLQQQQQQQLQQQQQFEQYGRALPMTADELMSSSLSLDDASSFARNFHHSQQQYLQPQQQQYQQYSQMQQHQAPSRGSDSPYSIRSESSSTIHSRPNTGEHPGILALIDDFY